jgi:hypothetical protein
MTTKQAEIKGSIERRVAFMARSGRIFDRIAIGLRRYLGISQKYSYQRVPDKLCHFMFDSALYLRYGKMIDNIGNAFVSLADFDGRFDQHPLHRGFFYDKSRHALVGTATGIDLNVSKGKHHIIELNRAIGILEIIRPIYHTKYGPEIYRIAAFAKKHQFKKVYVMYNRLHLYKKELIEASAELDVEMIPVSYPWVELDKNRKHYFMPEQLERDSLYMRLEPGYSPIMHYLSDKNAANHWLKKIVDGNPQAYSLIDIPETSNEFHINPANYSERWPTLVIKPNGKMQGRSVFMLKADCPVKAMQALQISRKEQMPPILRSKGLDRAIDKLFGLNNKAIYQDFVPPALKDGKAGRIRLNVFATPLESMALSDYYMWTVFDAPRKCPDGLLKDARPYIVNWAFSGKKAQFAELTAPERELTDPAIPQVCRLIQAGLQGKFISE